MASPHVQRITELSERLNAVSLSSKRQSQLKKTLHEDERVLALAPGIADTTYPRPAVQQHAQLMVLTTYRVLLLEHSGTESFVLLADLRLLRIDRGISMSSLTLITTSNYAIRTDRVVAEDALAFAEAARRARIEVREHNDTLSRYPQLELTWLTSLRKARLITAQDHSRMRTRVIRAAGYTEDPDRNTSRSTLWAVLIVLLGTAAVILGIIVLL